MIFLRLNCQLDNFRYTFPNFQELLKIYKLSFQNRHFFDKHMFYRRLGAANEKARR